jgi:hypothetical protein
MEIFKLSSFGHVVIKIEAFRAPAIVTQCYITARSSATSLIGKSPEDGSIPTGLRKPLRFKLQNLYEDTNAS